MPLEQVYMALLRNRDWMNVVLLRSGDLLQADNGCNNPIELVVANPNGFSWREQDVEYRMELLRFFQIDVRSNHFRVCKKVGKHLSFGLALGKIKHAEMAGDVVVGELPLLINSSTIFSLHCSNCSVELITTRQFRDIQAVPLVTMKPSTVFCGNYNALVYPREYQLFYGLNYVVVSPTVLGAKVKYTNNFRHLQCSRCLHYIGEVLGFSVAVQLYADALRVLKRNCESPSEFSDIFGHVTATQMLLRIMYDADLVDMTKARIILKAVRPDGQLHFLLLLMDINQIQILRSQLLPPTNPENDESSNGSDSNAMINNKKDGKLPNSQMNPPKVVKYLKIRGYAATRIKYLICSSDVELAANHGMYHEWVEDGSTPLRVSYSMMAELIMELNVNENLVAILEKAPIDVKINEPRLSYLIHEKDEEFYKRQEECA
ncbi:hypothetical protein KR018_003932 [Drosophila ironensis]|nr:hypothetical protein KR018_003932 [Drosophila ironensis]